MSWPTEAEGRSFDDTGFLLCSWEYLSTRTALLLLSLTMPARGRRGRPVPRLAAKSRVLRIVSKTKWTRAHERARGRLVFVLFAAEFGQNTHRLRQFVSEMSHQTNFKDAHFLYVDVEKVPEVAEECGIKSEEVPVFACFRNGQQLEKYAVDQKIEGVLAHAMFAMFSRHSAIREAETTEQHKGGFKFSLQIIGGVTLGALALGAAVMLNNPATSWGGARKILGARKLSNQGGHRLRVSNINDDEEQGDDYDASDDDDYFDDDF